MTKPMIMIVTSLALVAGSVWFLQGNSAMAKTYYLTLSGDADGRFDGTCKTARNGEEMVLLLKGPVPHEQEIVGHGLSCTLEVSGRVIVDIEYDGSLTRSASNSGQINIRLR